MQWPTGQKSLRSLASTYLQWTIQQGSHDSKEDAVAALRLVKLKLQHEPFFGVATTPDAQNLFDILHRHGRYELVLTVSTFTSEDSLAS